ncbi:protein containing RecF/RecN/SMC protein, partial [human gut metagenome]
MKIKKIHIDNILSYDKETINLNNDLNIIVGANGSGKSNLMNIIIYILKRFCFRNYEISNVNGIERVGIKRYSIQQKNPLYGLSEDYFLQKHKLKEQEKSLIDLTISFEDNDLQNLIEIKNKKEIICEFLDKSIDNFRSMDDIYAVDKNQVKNFFEVNEYDLSIGRDLCLQIRETDNGWKIENNDEKYYIYMKYFSLILDILNLLNINHKIKNPFVFFEAYRNNSSETTKVGITEFDNHGYTNLQSWQNLLSLNYSIGTNSTYIMLATKKYGKLMRNAIEKSNGLQEFYSSSDYIRLKSFFKKFEYDINLKCISPENNIYQFYLLKDGLEFVGICGKKNLNNFKNVLDKLQIRYFYIGDFDNIYDFEELSYLFEIDVKKQKEDLKKKKNQTYAVLDLLDSIDKFIKNNNKENFDKLKNNYNLYNERFVKIKSNVSKGRNKKIID